MTPLEALYALACAALLTRLVFRLYDYARRTEL